MRAVLVGLIGVALAGGAAQAATACRVDRALVTVKDTGERYAGQQVESPDLVGKTFEVQRFTSVRKMQYVASRGARMDLGYEAYELMGPGGVIFVKRERSASPPAVAPVSWASAGSGLSRSEVTWNSGRPGRVKVGQTLDYVLAGPLQSLSLEVSGCR